MNFFEALLSHIRKARSLRELDLPNKEDAMLGIMASTIVSINHKMPPLVILIRSENFGYRR
jgi:hypothetical protein